METTLLSKSRRRQIVEANYSMKMMSYLNLMSSSLLAKLVVFWLEAAGEGNYDRVTLLEDVCICVLEVLEMVEEELELEIDVVDNIEVIDNKELELEDDEPGSPKGQHFSY